MALVVLVGGLLNDPNRLLLAGMATSSLKNGGHPLCLARVERY